jgi:hypothetical protein
MKPRGVSLILKGIPIKLIRFVRALLLSLLFSIGILGLPLYTLGYISVGTGSGGAFDLPNLFELILLLGLGVFAFPFILGTFSVGLPVAGLVERLNLPTFSDVVIPVRHGTLTVAGHTATAEVIGIIVQVLFWSFIFFGGSQLKKAVQWRISPVKESYSQD